MSERLFLDLAGISDECVRLVDDILPVDVYDDYTRTEARQHATLVAALMAGHMIELINEEREQTEVVNELRLIDPITGIKNRLGFEKDLRSAAQEAQWRGTPLTIVALDLNNIDQVNEQQGRAEGDRWIVTTASILGVHSQALRSRWGGDEYSVILPNYDQEATDAWWQDANFKFVKEGINIGAGAVTLYIERGVNIDELLPANLMAADKALAVAKVESKACGQNCMVQTAMIVPGMEAEDGF